MSLYGGSLDKIGKSIKDDEDYRLMYTGFKRFFTEEKLFDEGTK